MKKQTKSYLYALTAVFLWSTVAVAFKKALIYYKPHQMIFISLLVATFVVLFIVIIQKKINLLFKQTKKDILKSAATAIITPFAYYLVLFSAYDMLPAQIAQPLNYTWPILLVLLSVPFLGQKITTKGLIAIIISFSGVFLISTQGNVENMKIDNPLGVTLAVSSALLWATYWIINTRDNRDAAVKLLLNFIFGTIYSAIIVILKGEINFSLNGFIACAYIGFFELGFTFFFWMKAMELTKTTEKIGNLVYLSPFTSLIWINIFLNEKIYFTTIAGLTLIITGIIFQKYQFKQNAR